MTPDDWKGLLAAISRDLIAYSDNPLSEATVQSGWLGFEPATEGAIVEAEKRLGVRLPPSLRTFYSVSNGWSDFGCFIWNLLPVQEIDWLVARDPDLYQIAVDSSATAGPFEDDPNDVRLNEFRHEQGFRVMRSLAITSEGDASTWLLDPQTRSEDDEWAGGRWSSWNPAMEWIAASFAELVQDEYATFLRLRSGKVP